MQGFVLPLVVAALLAAPVVWRLGGDMRESPAAAIDSDDRSRALPLSLTAHSLDESNATNAVVWQSRTPVEASMPPDGFRHAKGTAAASDRADGGLQ